MKEKKIGEKVWIIFNGKPLQIKIDLIKTARFIKDNKKQESIIYISYDGCGDFDSIQANADDAFSTLSDYVDSLKKEFPKREDWVEYDCAADCDCKK